MSVSPDKAGEGEDPLEKGVLHFVVSSKELPHVVDYMWGMGKLAGFPSDKAPVFFRGR